MPFIEEKANISPHPPEITLGVFEISLGVFEFSLGVFEISFGVFEITLGISKGALCHLRMVSPQTSKDVGVNVEGDLDAEDIVHTFALS